jgi:dipeptidyl aminopeptidase/acylaminoacyl peptidase
MRAARQIAAVFLASFLVQAAAWAQPAFTVEEMLKLRRVSDQQLSPDGRLVAYVITDVNLDANTRINDIWVVPVAGGEPRQVTRSDRSDDRPRWSPDGRRLAFISTRDGSSQIWTVPVGEAGPAGAGPDGAVKLTDVPTEASGVIWSPDGKWLAFVSDVFPECSDLACNERKLKEREASKVRARLLEGLLFRHWSSWKDDRYSHLFVVPSDGSAPPRDLTPGAADVPPFSLGGPEDYAFSPDSREIAFVRKTDPVEATSTNSDIFVLDFTDPQAKPRQVTTNPAADGGPVYSPDGRYIAYRAQHRAGFEADRWQLMLYDRKAGTHRSATPDFDRSVDDYTFSPDGATVYFAAEDQGAVPLFRLDLSAGAPQAIVTGGANSGVRVAPDGRTLVFSRASLTAPAEIYRANADGSGVAAITRTNEALLSQFRLRPGESLWFEGAGGVKVQAWVVKPANFDEGRRYPLIYLVHGGPQGAWNDSWTYRWNAQVFAAAGYVVFMPNPRGSTGFGQQFTDEISRDW